METPVNIPQDVRGAIQLPPGVAVSVPGPVERTAKLPGEVLVALRANILPLPSTTISDLATFDERDYEFVDLEEEKEVLMALGNVNKKMTASLEVVHESPTTHVAVVKRTLNLRSLNLLRSTLP